MAPLSPLNKSVPLVAVVLLLEPMGRVLTQTLAVHPLAATLVVRLMQMAVMIWGIRRWNPLNTAFLTDSESLKRALTRGLVWSLSFGACVGIGGLILLAFGINPIHLVRGSMPKDPATLALLFLTGALIGPLAEELLFRGFLFGGLRPLGLPVALAVSTLFFAGAHGLSGAIPITQIAGGLLFGLAYEKEGHILTPMVIHVLGNSALFTLSTF